MKQKDKQEKKAFRKSQVADDQPAVLEGEDPDLAGLHVGPQAPLFE